MHRATIKMASIISASDNTC